MHGLVAASVSPCEGGVSADGRLTPRVAGPNAGTPAGTWWRGFPGPPAAEKFSRTPKTAVLAARWPKMGRTTTAARMYGTAPPGPCPGIGMVEKKTRMRPGPGPHPGMSSPATSVHAQRHPDQFKFTPDRPGAGELIRILHRAFDLSGPFACSGGPGMGGPAGPSDNFTRLWRVLISETVRSVRQFHLKLP